MGNGVRAQPPARGRSGEAIPHDEPGDDAEAGERAEAEPDPEPEAESEPGPDPDPAARDRRERATRVFFSEICDEPLASVATAEALEQLANVASALSDDDTKAADERLLEIARATAGRHGLGVDGGTDAD